MTPGQGTYTYLCLCDTTKIRQPFVKCEVTLYPILPSLWPPSYFPSAAGCLATPGPSPCLSVLKEYPKYGNIFQMVALQSDVRRPEVSVSPGNLLEVKFQTY